MIKKVVIAAAGRGTRMLHLTKNKSKHLINILGAPFITYLLDNLLDAGYKELILVVGYRKEKIEEFLKKYKYKVKVINQFEILGEKEYGTACALKCVKEVIGNEDFLTVYGDNLYSVEDLKALNLEDQYTYVAGLLHKKPEKYGVLKLEDSFLEEIVEKPKKHITNLINTGLYKFTPNIFDKIDQIKLSQRGEYELTDAINLLASEKKVKVKRLQNFWLDFGNPADVIRASSFLKKCKS